MAKLIKKGEVESGDITPDTGFSDVGVKRAAIIDRETYEARADGQQIRDRAKAQAEQLIATAEDEARQIIETAQQEAARLLQEARDQGYNEGRAEGATELAEVVANAAGRMLHIEAQIIPQLKELAVKIARKVLGKELEFHPEAIVAIVKQALSDKARQRREIFLRVNPEDLAMIREHKSELLEVLSRAKEIGIREDPDVARYGVIIETDAGTIDAQLETQLAVFERVLKDAR